MLEEDLDSSTQDLVHKLQVMSIYPRKGEGSLIEGMRCLAVSSSQKNTADSAPIGGKKLKRYVLADQIELKSSSMFSRKSPIEELARRAHTKRYFCITEDTES